MHWATHPTYNFLADPLIQADAKVHGVVRYLRVNGSRTVPTFISETKPESQGRIVVYLTGAGLPTTIWSRLREELAFRSIVFDREGLGWSEFGTDAPASTGLNMSSCPISACAHLIAVVNTIKDDVTREIILIGHSLGGAFALACAPELDRYLKRTSKWRVWTLVLLDSVSPEALAKPAFRTLLPLAAGALYRAAEYGLLERDLEIFQISKLPKRVIEPTRRVMLSPRHWAGFSKEVESLSLVPACLSHKDHTTFPTLILSAEGSQSIDVGYPTIIRDAIPGSDHMSIITDEKTVKVTASRIGIFLFAHSQ